MPPTQVPFPLSSAINLYLPAGTVITFKTGTPATHWAISKATIDNPNYQDYKTNGWTSQTSFTVTEAGHYGFVLKNGIHEVGGSIPLISTMKTLENLRFSSVFCISGKPGRSEGETGRPHFDADLLHQMWFYSM